MKYRILAIVLAAAGLASFFVSQMSPAFWDALDLGGGYVTAKTCILCAHVLLSMGALLEAAALWVSTRHEESRSAVRVVAMMFAGAGFLGLCAVGLELIAMG